MAEAPAVDARVKVSRIIHTIHATTDIYGCRLRYQDALPDLSLPRITSRLKTAMRRCSM